MINAADGDTYDRFKQGCIDGTVPPSDYGDILREDVMPIAPSGMSQVHIGDGTSTNANETAISVAMIKYAMEHKRDFSSL